jgi:transcriptional regulator with XRE-family HTH domain
LRSQKVFFREWRQFRELNLEDAGELLQMSHANLSRIELGRQPYCEDDLDRMTAAYQCRREDLLFRHPRDPEPYWRIWDRLRTPTAQRQATAILEALATTSE